MAGENDGEELTVVIEEGPIDNNEGGSDPVVLVDQTGTLDETKGKAQVRRELPDDPVETLKAQLADKTAENERLSQRATSAESIASQAQQQVTRARQETEAARTEAAQSSRTTIDSGIAAAKAEADAAEEAYKIAFEAGNAADAAKAQRRIARAEADISMLEQAKAGMPEPQVRRAETRERPAQNQPVDQVEAWIQNTTPRTQNWLRAHMDIVRDPRKSAKMTAGHHDAIAEGLSVDTDEYFQHVERYLGLTKPAEPDPKPAPKAAANGGTQRRPTAPVAPVTPTGGGVNGGAGAVMLTKGEALAATDGTLQWNYDDPSPAKKFKKGDPIGLQEMARRKVQLAKDGKYLNANIDGT